jgi:phage baseplate assembly protein W
VASEFLGQGWNYPVQPETDQRIAMAAGEESIRQAIWLILGTARGERVMRPDFGCGIHDLVFAVNNATTAGLVAQAVQEALILWEPRIDVLNVNVDPAPEKPGLLLIQIDYRVRTTNSQFNLVYPFYLERSAT